MRVSRLVGVSLIEELVHTVILTGKIKDARPVSLLLLAVPESGKTSIVVDKQCEAVLLLSDATGRGIINACQQSKASHFVLPDFGAIMSHKPTVNRYTISMLIPLIEEGIKTIATPMGVIPVNSGTRGIIGCMPTKMAQDGRMWWHKTGFTSRLFPFCYDYPDNLVVKIKTAIAHGQDPSLSKPETWVIPAAPVSVSVPDPYPDKILAIATRIAHPLKEKGIRRTRQIRALAQAHALLPGRDWKNATVRQEDIDFLCKIEPYVSYSEARLLG